MLSELRCLKSFRHIGLPCKNAKILKMILDWLARN